VDRIEGVLYPLLRHDLERRGPRFVVDVGDKQVDFNDTFRLVWSVWAACRWGSAAPTVGAAAVGMGGKQVG